jgi:hypothetical protein
MPVIESRPVEMFEAIEPPPVSIPEPPLPDLGEIEQEFLNVSAAAEAAEAAAAAAALAEASATEEAPAEPETVEAEAAPATPARREDEPQGARARSYDLKKAAAPPPRPAARRAADWCRPRARRPAVSAVPERRRQRERVREEERKKRKVIKKTDMLETLERDRRPGKLRRKKRALPGRQHHTEIRPPGEQARRQDLRSHHSRRPGARHRRQVRRGHPQAHGHGHDDHGEQVLDVDTATLVAASSTTRSRTSR